MEERTFGYRGHVSWGQWILLGILGTVALASMALTLYIWFVAGAFSEFFFVNSLIYGCAALGTFGLFRALATFELEFRPDGLAYANARKEGVIAYEDLESVRGRYIPYVGGWLTLKSPETTLRLTVVMDDIDAFTRKLHDRLGSLDDPPFDRDNLFGFYKMAAYSDAAWDSTYDFWKLTGTAFLAMCMLTYVNSLFVPALQYASPVDTFFAVLIIGVIIPGLLMWPLDVFWTGRWLSKRANIETFEMPNVPKDVRLGIIRKEMMALLGVSIAANTALWLLF